MVSFLRLYCGLVAALVTSVSSLEDDFRLMADFLESDHRYITLNASESRGYNTDQDQNSRSYHHYREQP